MANFMMPVDLYMSSPVRTAVVTEPLSAIQSRLIELRISSLAVVDPAGAPVGVISRTDLLRVGRRQAGSGHSARLLALPAQPVGEVMTVGLRTVTTGAPLADAARRMVDDSVHRVFVTHRGELVGVVSTRDLMRAIHDKRVNRPMAELMSKPVFSVRAREPVSVAAERLERARISGLVVVDDDVPVGLFSQSETLAARDLPRETPVEDVMNHALLCLGVGTPLHRAAAQAAALQVRRIVALEDGGVAGILSGLDMARAVV